MDSRNEPQVLSAAAIVTMNQGCTYPERSLTCMFIQTSWVSYLLFVSGQIFVCSYEKSRVKMEKKKKKKIGIDNTKKFNKDCPQRQCAIPCPDQSPQTNDQRSIAQVYITQGTRPGRASTYTNALKKPDRYM